MRTLNSKRFGVGRALRLGCLLGAAACAENPSSPASTDHSALSPTAGSSNLGSAGAGVAGSVGVAGSAGVSGAAGSGAAASPPRVPGPPVDGAALPEASQAWSVAELLSHGELAPGDEVQVQGYAARVDLCKPCPPGAACDACFAQVALGDSADPAAVPAAAELVSIVGPFTEGIYDFALGQRLVFRGQFRSRMASLRAAAAELRYLSYAQLDAAP